MEIAVETMNDSSWPEVVLILREGIATGNATFEDTVPTWEQFDQTHLPNCRLVARSGDVVVGWIALGTVSRRRVYEGVAEVSVYVKASARGRGVGRTLLDAAIGDSERAGIWMLQAGIFPENTASLALHRQCGFRTVGIRERIGRMNGLWRDVVLLERRSRVTGV
ncbi:GNAT family N-acetyltransferase [Anaerobaca lacustris]|uniref:GNAT family N-acetyltransferase n=1 Tax=Anaerobaca lacustris TaxID=3044600 RepID=A0AAW6U5D6_9BACT|nr:GNAT family N-acetyltransferase [Sedimentisphaerales bacterium M17dextr]